MLSCRLKIVYVTEGAMDIYHEPPTVGGARTGTPGPRLCASQTEISLGKASGAQTRLQLYCILKE